MRKVEVKAPGSCGEFIQGRVGPDPCLVSCPVDLYSTVTIAEDPVQSSADVRLDATSFSTGNADRDGHVKGAEFLDVETYPELRFRSSGVRQDGDDWILDGELTVRDVTRPVALALAFDGAGLDPWGKARIAFSATTQIDRDEFGITWNQALETGGLLVGKTVKITVDVQAVAAG